MATTVIAYGQPPHTATSDAAGVWLDTSDLETATGWSLKPEGMCREAVCVPIPPGSHTEFVRGETLNLQRFAEHMGQPVVHEPATDTWVFGEAAGDRLSRLASLEAPDFELPDLEGRMHRLSDYRGNKVLVVTWASW